MSRYIDADALKRRVCELIVPEWVRTLIRTWLESAPTVDAVPVVRCKECQDAMYGNGNERVVWCTRYREWKSKDGFCDEGEREEKDNADC